MTTSLMRLLDEPRFIPFVYDYCDMWCQRCALTSRCLMFAAEQVRARRGPQDEAARVAEALELARGIVERTGPSHKAIAQLDVALCDITTAPREPALGHPLEFLARHYAIQAAQFLRTADRLPDGSLAPGSPLEVIAWYHFLIAAKTYRALISHFSSEESPELLPDALGAAKMILIAIDRSLSAWSSIAEEEDDARVGGLMELLEALKTGVEMRFPEARAFIRPGLDESVGVS